MILGIVGLDELIDDLEELGDIDLYQPIAQATEFVRTAARGLAPVAPYGGGGELRDSIRTDIQRAANAINGIVYTNKEYAPYVEFGTGPKGMASHSGISPDVNPTYVSEPWWMHESMLDDKVAETYNFFSMDTEQGKFYLSYGQAAQPFMYPALNDNKDVIADIITDFVEGKI